MKFINVNFHNSKVTVSELNNTQAQLDTITNLTNMAVRCVNHKNYIAYVQVNPASITYACKNEHAVKQLTATAKMIARTV